MRCGWCGKKCNEKFCSKECEENFENFLSFANKNKNLFYLATTLPLLLFILTIVTEYGYMWVGITVMIEGAVAIALPFATPQTNALFGMKRSIEMVRIIGGILLILGSSLIVYEFI